MKKSFSMQKNTVGHFTNWVAVFSTVRHHKNSRPLRYY